MKIDREKHILPFSAPQGQEIFAIGDIHGRADLFDALLEAAAAEPKREARRRLVLLGDLVDRGPENLLSLGLAAEAPERIGADDFAPLMGNHEQMMRLSMDPEIDIQTAADTLSTWAANGGNEVIAEIWPEGPPARTARRIVEGLRKDAPDGVLNWLRALGGHVRIGPLLFVHAGVHPDLDLDACLSAPWNVPLSLLDSERHWAWVRDAFLTARPGPDGFSGCFVIHGHTPRDAGLTRAHSEQIARFRLNLDGGSGFTGQSKMALIRGGTAEVFTTMGLTNRELFRD